MFPKTLHIVSKVYLCQGSFVEFDVWIGVEELGEPKAARSYYERALAIRESVLGPEHPDTARSLSSLGSLLQELGEPNTARPYLERALTIREKVLEPEHPDTARSLNNLGSLL